MRERDDRDKRAKQEAFSGLRPGCRRKALPCWYRASAGDMKLEGARVHEGSSSGLPKRAGTQKSTHQPRNMHEVPLLQREISTEIPRRVSSVSWGYEVGGGTCSRRVFFRAKMSLEVVGLRWSELSRLGISVEISLCRSHIPS
jgi:hypothetical protein